MPNTVLLEAVNNKDLDLLCSLLQDEKCLIEEIENDYPALRRAVALHSIYACKIASAISISQNPQVTNKIPDELKQQLHAINTQKIREIDNFSDDDYNQLYTPLPALTFTFTPGPPEDLRIPDDVVNDKPARLSLFNRFGGFRHPFAEASNDRPSIRQRILARFICGYRY